MSQCHPITVSHDDLSSELVQLRRNVFLNKSNAVQSKSTFIKHLQTNKLLTMECNGKTRFIRHLICPYPYSRAYLSANFPSTCLHHRPISMHRRLSGYSPTVSPSIRPSVGFEAKPDSRFLRQSPLRCSPAETDVPSSEM